MIEKIHIYITIIAAMIVNIACLLMSSSLFNTSVCLVVTIVVFYFIGLYVRGFFQKVLFPPKTEESLIDEASESNMADTENEEVVETEI